MIRRLVKLTLKEEEVDAFKTIFETSKNKIKAAGCVHVELWQNDSEPNVFFTYSLWPSEEDLESYRSSPVFRDIWARLKPMFAQKPEAWSNHKIHETDA